MPKKVKRIIHLGILRPILLYGSETWNINKTNLSKIVAADMKVIRLINQVTKMDKIRNIELYKWSRITPIATKIKNSQIQWFGHVRRRPPEHLVAQAYNYKIDGTRPTGRPRKRWHQYVDEYLQEKGTDIAEVERKKSYNNRDEWKKLTTFPD